MISQIIFLLIGMVIGWSSGLLLDWLVYKIFKREKEELKNWMPSQKEIDEQLHIDN
jgi:hypothetical protein